MVLELSDAYNIVDSYIINKWQQTWDSTPTGSHYRTIEKTVSTKIKYLNASRHRHRPFFAMAGRYLYNTAATYLNSDDYCQFA